MWSIYPVTAVVLMLAVFQPAFAQDRLPPIPASEMSQAQRTIVETFEIERGYALRGPWVPLLRSPEILDLMIDVRDHVRDLQAYRVCNFAGSSGMDTALCVECALSGCH